MTFHPHLKASFALLAFALAAPSIVQQALRDGISVVTGTVAHGGWIDHVFDVSTADGLAKRL